MTNAELAILSLLVEQPRHGYNLEQVIEERGMRDWTEIGFSSIYYILRKLEKDGLIKSHTEPSEGKGPGRKVYQVTPEGSKAWYAAALESLSTRAPHHKPFLMGLSVLPAFQHADTTEALTKYKTKLQEERDHVKGRWQEQSSAHPLPPHVDAMFDYSLTLIEGELKWIEDFIQKMESKG
jgi:DNA-binding PadR family transcriptional regulator